MNVQLQNHSGTAVLTWNNWAVLSVCLWFRFSNGRFFTSLIQSANQSCDDQLLNKVLKHIFLNHWKSLGCVVPKSNSVRFTKNELPGDFRVLLHIAPLGSEKKTNLPGDFRVLLHIAPLGSAISNVNKDCNIDENRNNTWCWAYCLTSSVISISIDVVIFGEFQGGFLNISDVPTSISKTCFLPFSY